MDAYERLQEAIVENGGVGCEQAPDAFFFEEEGRDANREYKKRLAKKICEQCPVQMLCLEYALENHEQYGIWGGLTKPEREKILGRKLRYAVIH